MADHETLNSSLIHLPGRVATILFPLQLKSVTCAVHIYAFQGSASVIQTDAMGDSVEVARLDDGNYFGEVRLLCCPPN